MINHVKEKEYWNKILGDEYEKVHFNNADNEENRDRRQIELNLKPEVSGYLASICKDDDMLLHMLFLNILKVVFYKYSRSASFFIGIPQFIKTSSNVSNNPFIVFSNKILGENSFKEELIQTKKNILEAYVYQFYDMEDLYRSENIYKKVNVYCCMRSLHNNSQIEEILGLSGNELTFILDKNENNLHVSIHYRGLKDEVKIITKMLNQALNSITKNIDILIENIDLVSDGEKQQLLVQFNNTETAYTKNKTIHQLFEEQVENTPNHTAAVFEGRKLTYKELNESANSLACVLKEKDVGPNIIVGIMAEPSIELVIGILAILKAGGAYLPIDPAYPASRIEFMINNSGVNLILTQGSAVDRTPMGCDLIDLDNETLYQREGEIFSKESMCSDLAYVIYTSGTTGRPKGVAIEHKGIVNLTNTFRNDIGVNCNKRILQFASISFDAFAWELYMSILFGAELHITNKDIRMNPHQLSEYIKDFQINILTVPPFIANELNLEDSQVELIITAGSDAKKNMVTKLSKKSRYINAYGPTEGSICATIWESTEESAVDIIPIGKPISNTRVYIVDDNLQLIPIGVSGELCISGDGLARGYLANRDLTDQKFVNNPFETGGKMYKTGDLARWLPDGNIEYLGRMDHQVKIRGFRIELAEIENRIIEIKGVKDAIVLDKGESESKYLCAYYTTEISYSVDEMRQTLAQQLPNYMIPSYFIKLSEMPLTTNGKIDRQKLPEAAGEIPTGAIYEEPRNEIEGILVKVWKQVLGVNKISINDNFFSLGGNSLNAVKIASILQEENIVITLSDLFMYQDIKSISYHYSAHQNDYDKDFQSEIKDTLIGRENLDKYISLNRSKLNSEFKEFAENILSKQQTNIYKLTAIQKMSRKIGLTKSGTKVEFHSEVDIPRLERAVKSLINQEEILRAAIVENQSEMYLYEYDTIDQIKLPVLDISIVQKDLQEFALKEVIKDITVKVHGNCDYAKDKINYVFILVKKAGNHYVLYMIVNHLIFDGMSSEIVKNLLLKEYKNDGKGGTKKISQVAYQDYVHQIKIGPQNITEEEIIEEFNLAEYMESSRLYLEKLSGIKNKLVFKPLEFNIPPEILQDQDQLWEFALDKFIEISKAQLNIETLPISILNMGRRFGDKNYFTVIGEFLDIIPFLCTKSESNIKKIRGLMDLAGKKNLNFLTLLNEKEISQGYKKVIHLLHNTIMRGFDIPIFNYLGVYEADYTIGELFQESDEFHHTQRGANCYVRGDRLIIFMDILEDKYGGKEQQDLTMQLDS